VDCNIRLFVGRYVNVGVRPPAAVVFGRLVVWSFESQHFRPRIRIVLMLTRVDDGCVCLRYHGVGCGCVLCRALIYTPTKAERVEEIRDCCIRHLLRRCISLSWRVRLHEPHTLLAPHRCQLSQLYMHMSSPDVATSHQWSKCARKRMSRATREAHKLTLPFPVDRLRFDYEGIGGASYRLPDNAEIGYSYIMFVITLVFIFVSQLMTMKVLFEDFMP
jgi:hypothetical protein